MTEYSIGSDLDYAKWQEYGTGPIQARAGGFLVFKPKGSGTVVFAKRTRGVPATYFLHKAYAELTLSDFL